MRLRLLPRDPVGKMGYVWLVYLGSPVSYLAYRHDATSVAATVAAIAVFVPLYFWGYWLQGARTLLPIAGITAVALWLSPSNPGGTVFFIYAAAFAHRVGRPRLAVGVLVGIVLTILGELWLGVLDIRVSAWALVITPVIGGITIYATDNARKLLHAQEQARHLAVVAERERIGRDLHDLLGHTLSVIALKSELASKLAGRDPERSIAEIRDVERISRDALAEVRRAVLGSRDGHALTDELAHARTALDAAGVILECHVASGVVAAAVDHTLAFALREAVTNVVRHARAQRCTITLETDGPFARLSIDDDGVGGDGKDGAGLAGMRTRVTELGGQLERNSRQGTRLTITLPLPGQVAAPPTAKAAV